MDPPSSLRRVDPPASLLIPLICGGFAGLSVDVLLFPIDTVKTRLQSPSGFTKSGGFKGIYRGIGAVTIGSWPGAALFFTTYEHLKPQSCERFGEVGGHMFAASCGEVAACMVRVPTEVIKSNMQVDPKHSPTVAKSVIHLTKSSPLSLYRGFAITIFREIPFAFIQFPIYERMKSVWARRQGVERVSAAQSAVCGSVAGGFAAAVTTPLDVVKTRMMIGVDGGGRKYGNVVDTAGRILRGEGWRTFFSGVQPRVAWISIGGGVFFGSYEFAKSLFGPR